jgi:hypothetical protein
MLPTTRVINDIKGLLEDKEAALNMNDVFMELSEEEDKEMADMAWNASVLLTLLCLYPHMVGTVVNDSTKEDVVKYIWASILENRPDTDDEEDSDDPSNE